MSESDPDLKLANEIPNHIIISLARLLLPEIQAFYNSNEGKEFVEALKTASKTKYRKNKLRRAT